MENMSLVAIWTYINTFFIACFAIKIIVWFLFKTKDGFVEYVLFDISKSNKLSITFLLFNAISLIYFIFILI